MITFQCDKTDGNPVWLTPKWLVDALNLTVMCDLDPCSLENRPWGTARRHIYLPEDGLAADWQGIVWCNPPYGSDTGKWLDKLSKHPAGGLALIFARTDTAAWHDYVFNRCHGVMFIRGRLTFALPSGQPGKTTAGAPSALVCYGRDALDILEDAIPRDKRLADSAFYRDEY